MTRLKYSKEDLEKMKKIPGTFMWIKESENKKLSKVAKYEEEILSVVAKNRRI